MVVYVPWSWVCYPEAIESQRADGDGRVGNGADGEDDGGHGGEGRVAS